MQREPSENVVEQSVALGGHYLARTRTTRLRRMLAGCGAGLIMAITAPAVAKPTPHDGARPNIVVILADNLGYGDLGCYGGLRAATPRIDAFAGEGVRLRDFQVEPACTQSRAAFLTGRMPVRSGTSAGTNKGGLDPREILLPELLHKVGYDTALFGKWHLGTAPERQPQAQGFDRFYGILTSSEPVNPAIAGYADVKVHLQDIVTATPGHAATPVAQMTYEMRGRIDRDLASRGVEYIREHARGGKPFFLEVSFINVHHPVVPHPDFAGKSSGGAYSDALMEMDYNTGLILDALRNAGLEQNTIVIWMSDNGATRRSPDPDQNADPGQWSGDLGSAWEGSLRTAAMVRWPGHIPAGRIEDGMIHIMDFYPTLAHAAGTDIPHDRPVDGIDQTDYLTGKVANSPRDGRLVVYLDRLVAIRYKQFKLHKTIFPRFAGALSKGEDLEVPRSTTCVAIPRRCSTCSAPQGDYPWPKPS